MMAVSSAAGTRPCICSPATARPSSRSARQPFFQRRQTAVCGIKDDLIGRVNNPEESRENAERKHNDENSQWATPRPNKNKLEKKTIAHGIGGPGEEIDGDIVEKAKEGVEDAVDSVKDAAKKVTGQD